MSLIGMWGAFRLRYCTFLCSNRQDGKFGGGHLGYKKMRATGKDQLSHKTSKISLTNGNLSRAPEMLKLWSNTIDKQAPYNL